ncbi:hypothetical protein SNE40_014411 [Patella caerulea]|uniref:Glutathione transferase n=1 Tax=Patella caerulea TaxID=87958 RepID=A0AAN8JFK8_PATCE
MPTYRLHYFDVRGRGEIIRLLFNAAGQKFEDVRYTKETWPLFKPLTPLGQLPCLEVDGTLYPQSGAIYSYLAREFGLYGKNNMEIFKVDIVMNIINDLMPFIVSVFVEEKDEEKKKILLEKLVNDDAPKYLAQLEHVALQNGGAYFVGNSLTLADLAVFDLTDNLLQFKPDILSTFPLIVNNRKVVESSPALTSYLKTRK